MKRSFYVKKILPDICLTINSFHLFPGNLYKHAEDTDSVSDITTVNPNELLLI